MDPMTFLSRRFETELKGPIIFGDVVIDEYGEKAIVLRNPYITSEDHAPYTRIFYGNCIHNRSIEGLEKTGKNFSKELNIIIDALKEKV